MSNIILVIGACGQIGTELTLKLRKKYGGDSIIASDIKNGNDELMSSGPFEIVDATCKEELINVIQKHSITQVYQMAAMLSAVAEKHPLKAWNLNMVSLLNILEIAKEGYIKKVFWPSSMGAYGMSSPKIDTPQQTIMQPNTVYGISKVSGELWCNYYSEKYDVDVRSVRYPGIISWKALPGGGTTDYAVDIYYKAVLEGKYECFLSEDTRLPMMYMDDAIKATITLMEHDKLPSYKAYNVAAMSFTPKEVAAFILKYYPKFSISYKPDFRQEIADSWPQSLDDSEARKDWNWKPVFNLEKMTEKMLFNLRNKYNLTSK